LAPDLVVVNDEENRIEDADALVAAGLRVHSMSPRSVDDVGPAVVALGEEIGILAPPPFGPDAWGRWLDAQGTAPWARAAVLVWRRPWMTMNGDTYGSSLLELLGVENVFAPDKERYPQVTLDAISDRDPDCVLLPSEPYPFKERHIAEIAGTLPETGVRLLDGRDLFWWGSRTPAATARLRAALTPP